MIKCHMCKLEIKTCDLICIVTEDVTSLYKEGMAETDAYPKGFCTAHKCQYNPSGFRCILEKCVYGLGEQRKIIK